MALRSHWQNLNGEFEIHTRMISSTGCRGRFLDRIYKINRIEKEVEA